MSNKKYFTLLVLALIMAGISSAFGQQAVKNKKERIEMLIKELGLGKEQSTQLIEQQEKYSQQISQLLQDTSVKPLQRSTQLKALSQQYNASLGLLLSPEQQAKMTKAIMGRDGGRFLQKRQELERRLSKVSNKDITIDSNKVKNKN